MPETDQKLEMLRNLLKWKINMPNKVIYVLTDSEEQIIGVFETFELAKENVELLCSEYEFDKYYYTDEELSKLKIAGNIANVTSNVRVSLENHSENPNNNCNGSWIFFTVTEYKLNELVEW